MSRLALLLALVPALSAHANYHHVFVAPEGWVTFGPFDTATDFSEGVAYVRQGNSAWLMNRKGERLASTYEGEANPSRHGLIRIVSPGETHWYVDHKGQKLGGLDLSGSQPQFGDGFAAAKTNGKWGLLDRSGNWAVPPTYAEMGAYSEGLVAVEKDGKWGFIDASGAVRIPFEFSYVKYGEAPVFQEGVALVSKDPNKWGAIDRTGAWALAPEYESLFSFHEGVASVRAGRSYGAVDLTGRWVAPISRLNNQPLQASSGLIPGHIRTTLCALELSGVPRFCNAQDGDAQEPLNGLGTFQKGFAFASSRNNRGILDTKGRWVFALPSDGYFEFGPLSEGLFRMVFAAGRAPQAKQNWPYQTYAQGAAERRMEAAAAAEARRQLAEKRKGQRRYLAYFAMSSPASSYHVFRYAYVWAPAGTPAGTVLDAAGVVQLAFGYPRTFHGVDDVTEKSDLEIKNRSIDLWELRGGWPGHVNELFLGETSVD